MNVERNAFWKTKASWPDDAYGFVFLARALHQVGRALYGESWTGEEPVTPPLFNLWDDLAGKKFLKPRSSVAVATEIELLTLLRKHAPDKVILEPQEIKAGMKPLTTVKDVKRGASVPASSRRIVNMVMTAETWSAAIDVAEKENSSRKAAHERLAAAQGVLKVAIRDGKLRYVLLPLKGGRFSGAMPCEWWNRKDHDRIFSWCQINPETPFNYGIGGDRFQHVFVDGSELDALITINTSCQSVKSDEMNVAFERAALIEAMEAGRTSPRQEVFIKEAREDGTIFWGGSPPWPRDTPDYVFLGRAVNLIGRGRFPEEWHENELSELFLPMFFEGKEHVIRDNSYEEMYLSCVVDAVEKDHGVKLEPLDAYFRFIAEDRRKSRDRIWTVYEILVKAFVEGDLKSYGQKIGGGTPFEEIPAIEWTRDDITDWFMFCHQGPYAHSPSRLKRTLPSDKLPKFIFVERASLQAFLQEWGHGLAFFPYAERLPILDTFVGDQPTDDQTIITEPDEAVVSEINGIRFTATERDIHNAVEAIWKGGPMPKAKMQFQAAVNKYLKDQLRYAKSPDPRTYQRYFKKLGATLADK